MPRIYPLDLPSDILTYDTKVWNGVKDKVVCLACEIF